MLHFQAPFPSLKVKREKTRRRGKTFLEQIQINQTNQNPHFTRFTRVRFTFIRDGWNPLCGDSVCLSVCDLALGVKVEGMKINFFAFSFHQVTFKVKRRKAGKVDKIDLGQIIKGQSHLTLPRLNRFHPALQFVLSILFYSFTRAVYIFMLFTFTLFYSTL